MPSKAAIFSLMLTGLLLAACGPAAPLATQPAEAAQSDQPTREAFHWMDRDFTDVQTGETFRIDDYAGKVVLVETMALWCPTCLLQAGAVQDLHEALGHPDDLISVSLDVDRSEDAAALKAYAENYGLDWHIAVADLDTLRALGNLYSANYLNPPLAPMLLVDREGNVHQLDFGLKQLDALQAFVQPFLEQ